MADVTSTDPTGISSAIKEWQIALPNFGISYSGPSDGIMNPSFTSAMLALEMKLEINTGIPAINHIYSGSSIFMSPSKVRSIYIKAGDKSTDPATSTDPTSATPTPSSTDTTKPTGDASINAWQSFLSQSQPLVGKLYSGPVDGTMNDSLAGAAASLESAISSKLKNSNVTGKIFANNHFLTDPSDVLEGLKILQTKITSDSAQKPADSTASTPPT